MCSLTLDLLKKTLKHPCFALYTCTQVLLTNFTCSRLAYYDDSGGRKLGGLLWRFQFKDLSINERVWAWCCVCCQAHQGLTVWFLLLRYSVVCSVESLSLFYHLFISWFICTWRWFVDKLGIVHAKPNIYAAWSTSELRVRSGWYRETS